LTASSKRMRELFNSSPVAPDKKKRDLEERLSAPVAPLEEQQAAVTPQEWKFIQELVDGEGKQTLKQAAINAGYDPARAHIIAHELTDPRKNPQIVAAIQQYRRDMADKYGTNIERHLRDMQMIRDKALEAGNYSAAVMAEYRRGQALGTIYVDRKEIRHGTIDSMSADEVRRKLEEIKALYGGPPPQGLIEVVPETVVEPLPAPEESLLEEIKRGAEREHALQGTARSAD
jgi:phage terminase small subunit